ncbi:hypothetical protein IMSAGC013_04063 [Lachnospiraceae bacterium]|nr:hypothetical protein IMSAGC013_04063 [Lachnospiraceae bacterium]
MQMDQTNINLIVKQYREKIIEGKCIDLIPVKEELLPTIVELRNQERSRYYFNQSVLLTLEMQKKWYEEYIKRYNDIYWCIRNKEHVIVGTVRLYNITENSCDHGSVMIDEKYSMGMPYALEAEILSLEFAFDVLKVRQVYNDDRHDNKMMNSISKKMGFVYQNVIDVGGIPYNHYILEKENLKTEKYKAALDKFMDR